MNQVPEGERFQPRFPEEQGQAQDQKLGQTHNDPGYNASDIVVLPSTEGIRRRPTMYVRDTGRKGLHGLVESLVDDGIDGGLASTISVRINVDGSVTVSDNGRGLPVGPAYDGRSTLEVLLTELFA